MHAPASPPGPITRPRAPPQGAGSSHWLPSTASLHAFFKSNDACAQAYLSDLMDGSTPAFVLEERCASFPVCTSAVTTRAHALCRCESNVLVPLSGSSTELHSQHSLALGTALNAVHTASVWALPLCAPLRWHLISKRAALNACSRMTLKCWEPPPTPGCCLSFTCLFSRCFNKLQLQAWRPLQTLAGCPDAKLTQS